MQNSDASEDDTTDGFREIVGRQDSPAGHFAGTDFASDVAYYLSLDPRQLPSRYLYDALGSALFDAICELPWYRITRAELGLLESHGAEIISRASHGSRLPRIVELGPGNGAKLVPIVRAARRTARGRPQMLRLHLIDLSAKALDDASRTLAAFDDLEVVRHATTYERGLQEMAHDRREHAGTLVLFLGSNIGNFDPPGCAALLRALRSALDARGTLLVGADLVKPERDLLLAYDDPLGVTGAFNRNILVRINRELGADFDIDAFRHRAVWNSQKSRVEMHLVSLLRQQVHIPAADLEFTLEEGETIWTESSYKYPPQELVGLLQTAGFDVIDRWYADEERFALMLGRVAEARS